MNLPTIEQVIDRIDSILDARCEHEGVQPTPAASDAVFLRRASLDITGLIPSVIEARQFLNGEPPFDGPDKRAVLIGRRRHCILLWMNGGPSQLDTYDMEPNHKNGGDFKEIATSVSGLRFSEHLPKLAAQAEHLANPRQLRAESRSARRGTIDCSKLATT